MKKSIIASAAMLLSASLLTGCVIHVGDASALEGSDFSSILGNIDIAEGKHAGDISSVNGNVEISDHGGVRDRGGGYGYLLHRGLRLLEADFGCL